MTRSTSRKLRVSCLPANPSVPNPSLDVLLEKALAARENLFDEKHRAGFRLFNGFSEGNPQLVIDLYGKTILIHNYADIPSQGQQAVESAARLVLAQLPWVACILVKTRNGQTQAAKQGLVMHGKKPDDRILENNVWYALDLQMNRDAGFYLDTRNLRRWAIENLAGQTVLNAFAYTGSLGIAARAGRATRVVQLDRNRSFLNLAKTSCTLNGYPVRHSDYLVADFFPAVSQLKRSGQTFDCIFLDPPFFASTAKGTVDLQADSARLINKVRPLINDGGVLVAINNALFLSGADYLHSLEQLCADGYLQIEQLIPIPKDFTGYPATRLGDPPIDPAPFNHPTKIVILRVRRKTSPDQAQ